MLCRTRLSVLLLLVEPQAIGCSDGTNGADFLRTGQGQPAITVQVVAVEKQSAVECGLRVATAGALLCFGKAIDLVSRVKYPPIETQYKDFEHCLVESQWLPRWAENLQFHEEPFKALATFEITHPPNGRSILPLSLSIVYSASYARD